SLETLDDPHLPQRLSAVEPLREDPRNERFELLAVPRRRQGCAPKVVVEVEPWIVDPPGARQSDRRVRELVAKAGDSPQPLGDVIGPDLAGSTGAGRTSGGLPARPSRAAVSTCRHRRQPRYECSGPRLR